jgi:hypothetical protein
MEHEIKVLPKYFWSIWKKIKTFEIRRNDRDYKVGDTLILLEWRYVKYTGRKCRRTITYVLADCEKYGLKDGFVILGMK